MALVITEKAHAEFSASGSERWLNCPGSIKASKGRESKSSIYADEGTKAHDVLEKLFKAYIDFMPNAKLKALVAAIRKEHPEEMVTHAVSAIKVIRQIERTTKGHHLTLCETKIDASKFTCAGQFGTFDAAVIGKRELTVIDYKYGAGIVVEPRDSDGTLNSQMAYYALGLLDHFDEHDFDVIHIVVIQPRAWHESGETVRRTSATIEEMNDWRETFKNGVIAAKAKKPVFKSGEWCRFCPAAIDCPTLKDKSLKQARVDFAPGNAPILPDPKTISPKALGQTLDAIQALKVWISCVEDHAFERMEHGDSIPGWKLVAKQARRKWTNENDAALDADLTFGSEAFSEPSLLSPSQLEKAIGGKEVKQWVEERTTRESSGLTMVRETDKRAAYEPARFEPID